MSQCDRERDICQDQWILLKAERDELYVTALKVISSLEDAIDLMAKAVMGVEIEPNKVQLSLLQAKLWKERYNR